MKYVKMLGIVGVTAVSLVVFVGAGSASATVLCKTVPTSAPTGTTCPASWALTAGSALHAVNTTEVKITSHEEFVPDVSCLQSTFEAITANEGDATSTVIASVITVTFAGGCNAFVQVLTKGTLEIHWVEGTHNGTVTSTGLEITYSQSSIFGTLHCIYKTNNTDLGVVTGNKVAGETVVWHVEGQPIPKVATNSLCPKEPTLDATYTITSQNTLTVTSHT